MVTLRITRSILRGVLAAARGGESHRPGPGRALSELKNFQEKKRGTTRGRAIRISLAMDRYGYGYTKPGDGTVWLECAMCKRSFRAYRYRLREGVKFCSTFCCWAAQCAFTRALADGRLDGLLSEELARAKAEGQERTRMRWLR
jgi:hypothetical protein